MPCLFCLDLGHECDLFVVATAKFYGRVVLVVSNKHLHLNPENFPLKLTLQFIIESCFLLLQGVVFMFAS